MAPFYRLSLAWFVLLGTVACKKEQEGAVEKPWAYATVSTVAGSGQQGLVDGPGTAAKFYNPHGCALDGQGNLYVADFLNQCIRKISPAGVVSTFAGDATGGGTGHVDGPGATARFFGPCDVAVDGTGTLYVADGFNHCIRKITPAGVVSTFAGTADRTAGYADGPGLSARFNGPTALALDAQGVLYVADADNNRIRKIMPTGEVQTVAGTGQRGFADGPAGSAQFNLVFGLAVDAAGTLYVSDSGNGRVRRITRAGVVSTLAGSGAVGYADGNGSLATFGFPAGLAVGPQGRVYVADGANDCVRQITAQGEVSLLAGTRTMGYADGPLGSARFNYPWGVAAGPDGSLYVTEPGGERIRKLVAQ